jgi:acetyl esterase/lipase
MRFSGGDYHVASRQLQSVIDMMRASDPLASGDLMTIRELTSRAPAYPKPDDIRWEAVDARGVPAEWVIPDDAEPGRAIVYCHGGGYVMGTVQAHRGLCSHLARAARARVLSVDYRLAPENRFPAAVNDALAAYRFTLAEGYAPESVALGGDSSGGGLVLGTLVALRDDGDPLPGAAICLSPWTDLSLTGESIESRRDQDPMVRASVLELMAQAYLGDADPRTPTASPLFADLTGLPPLLVQVGTAELLLDDARRIAERADAAGVDVTLDIWDDMIHVWQAFADFLPEAREAIARIGAYVDERLSAPPSARNDLLSPVTQPAGES